MNLLIDDQKDNSNKTNERERYTQILLEDLRSQFRAFGKDLEAVSRQSDETNKRLERIENRLDIEFGLIRKELAELKALLEKKADQVRLEILESRVDRLERIIVQSQGG